MANEAVAEHIAAYERSPRDAWHARYLADEGMERRALALIAHEPEVQAAVARVPAIRTV